MNILILGCGFITTKLVSSLSEDGHHVTVMDEDASALDAISRVSKTETVLVTRPLVEELPRGKVLEADLFIAITKDDNTNAMAAQAAKQIFGVDKVICHIQDPSLTEVYQQLDLVVVNPTVAMVDIIHKNVGE